MATLKLLVLENGDTARIGVKPMGMVQKSVGKEVKTRKSRCREKWPKTGRDANEPKR